MFKLIQGWACLFGCTLEIEYMVVHAEYPVESYKVQIPYLLDINQGMFGLAGQFTL